MLMKNVNFSANCKSIYSSSFRRFISKRPDNLIDVQLLKDHENLGVAGNIVTVKAGYMRQKLHSTKIACYLNDGPRIPVVETKIVKKVKISTPKPVKEEKVEDFKPLSLSELSSIFNNKSNNTSAPISLNAETEVSFSSHDINDSIPETNIFDSGDKITKDFLKTYSFDISGIEIPTTSMKIQGEKKEPLEDINIPGTYTWSISTSDGKTVKKVIIIQ